MTLPTLQTTNTMLTSPQQNSDLSNYPPVPHQRFSNSHAKSQVRKTLPHPHHLLNKVTNHHRPQVNCLITSSPLTMGLPERPIKTKRDPSSLKKWYIFYSPMSHQVPLLFVPLMDGILNRNSTCVDTDSRFCY